MDYMERAISLARGRMGKTSPNPAVGAVLVKSENVIAEGSTQPPGGDHAEIVALKTAGSNAMKSTLYVTLEPCCIYGKTPPCTKSLIEAGISKVYIASKDPNPKINGNGIRELQNSGIEVNLLPHYEGIKELYQGFSKHIKTKLPFVTTKYAMSLDGKIATKTGESKWITGDSARFRTHAIRSESDAVMVGINTVLYDDPQLTSRDINGDPFPDQPMRIIVDSKGRTPPNSKLFDGPGQTLIVTSTNIKSIPEELKKSGAELLNLESKGNGVDLENLLALLGNRGVVNLLVEGGGHLAGSLFDLGLVDKVIAFIAPTIIGGINAPSPVEGIGVDSLSKSFNITNVTTEKIGNDILVIGYPQA